MSKNLRNASLSDSFAANSRWRIFRDHLTRYTMAIGGSGVIVAVVLIFFYLVYEVIPLFHAPDARQVAAYRIPDQSRTLLYAIDEQAEIVARYSESGELTFFNFGDGKLLQHKSLKLPDGARIVSVAQASPESGLVGFGLSDGSVKLFRHRFIVTYPDDRRRIVPKLAPVLESEEMRLFDPGIPVQALAVQSTNERTTLVGWSKGQPLSMLRLEREMDFLSEEVTQKLFRGRINSLLENVNYLLLDKNQGVLYAADRQGIVLRYLIKRRVVIEFDQQVQVVPAGESLTTLAFLSGDVSLLAGSSSGAVSQWFILKDANKHAQLTKVRAFHSQKAPILAIAPEYSRKGFIAADAAGRVGIYNSTAQRTLMLRQVSDSSLEQLAIAPRANAFVAEDASGQAYFWRLANPHPEISWSSLWERVRYENYPESAYVWQSSAATNDFEPKFSLVPLSFGTLKAATYAMLVATPLAILGAIYTAYFMAPRLRQVVKPLIEMMEALPTVILGFLAGLWLAPTLESYLPGVFIVLVLLPSGLLFFAYASQFLPVKIRTYMTEGWLPLVLLPVVGFLGWLSFSLSFPVEQWLFGGDFKNWLTNDMGILFDQRNSIVVGVAMGFAVIPTIFSITEDAVFSVPKHLTVGSLALGATTWQTMTRIVIPTASPGIFSALMIGLGRAVGETMIVLMATGNTPIMDFNIFEGMRTLSANIAIEMPESEVASTHYRVLFLAALVLFVFTFLFNTFAEIVRHSLRRRYSSL